MDQVIQKKYGNFELEASTYLWTDLTAVQQFFTVIERSKKLRDFEYQIIRVHRRFLWKGEYSGNRIKQ